MEGEVLQVTEPTRVCRQHWGLVALLLVALPAFDGSAVSVASFGARCKG